MKKLAALLAVLTIAAQASFCQELALQWHNLDRGAQYAVFEGQLFGAAQCVSILRYPASKFKTDIVNDPGTICGKTSTLALRHGAYAAVNGSYFNVKTLYPSTYLKEDKVREGYTYTNELFRVNGILAAGKKKVFICPGDTLAYESLAKKYPDAVASGPVLLYEGKDVATPTPSRSFFTKRHPRTIVGNTKGGKWVYFMVIDGRFAQAVGMTVEEEVKLCQMLGLHDAINLDGGGSSCLWIEGVGVVSHPYDNKKYDNSGERRIPNIIMIR